MKELFYLSIAFVLFGCGESNETTSTEKDEVEQEEEIIVEESEGFTPFMEIGRYVAPEEYEFQTYTYESIFEYKFPEDIAFEENNKNSYTTLSKSTISQGSKYDLHINDYSKSEEAVIDSSFTEWVHDQLINYKFENYADPKMYKTELLETDKGLWGFYSCLSYVNNSDTIMMDYVTYGFDPYVVSIYVTASPYCENANVVKEYIDGFKILN